MDLDEDMKFDTILKKHSVRESRCVTVPVETVAFSNTVWDREMTIYHCCCYHCYYYHCCSCCCYY